MEELNVQTGTPVLLVSGENYPDALTISSFAAWNQYPVLLVRKDIIDGEVGRMISAIKPDKIYIIGLREAIGETVVSDVTTLTGLEAKDMIRIGGADRYATSLAVANYFNFVNSTVCIATGNNFPDALTGSVYAAKYRAPIILTDRTLPEQTVGYLESRKPLIQLFLVENL